jgi:hypothetical protein
MRCPSNQSLISLLMYKLHAMQVDFWSRNLSRSLYHIIGKIARAINGRYSFSKRHR